MSAAQPLDALQVAQRSLLFDQLERWADAGAYLSIQYRGRCWVVQLTPAGALDGYVAVRPRLVDAAAQVLQMAECEVAS